MKICFTTTLDDKYLAGFLITLNSILRSSKNFNYDFVIFEWGTLSDDSKNIIKSLYDNVLFKMVDIDSYKTHEFDETYRIWTYNPNYRFDIFTLTEYDRIVFVDADMIFEIDVDELLSYDVDFGSCSIPSGRVPQINDRMGFDAGLMTIGKKYISLDVKKELIKIANQEAPLEKDSRIRKWVGNEPILNTFFLRNITWLPNKFNLVVSEILTRDFENKNNYQFTGHNKPWYSEDLEGQFSPFCRQNIIQNNGKFMINIILKKLILIYKEEVKSLSNKGIDIKKYSDKIKPIYE